MEINIDNCVEKRRMVVVNKKNKRRKCECRRSNQRHNQRTNKRRS